MSQNSKEIAYVVFVGVFAVIISWLVSSAVFTTEAQNTAPTYEYAVLVYGNNDASVFTGDSETASELTALLVPQNSNAANIVLALNVMGADGWELVDMIPGGSTIYFFKRPK